MSMLKRFLETPWSAATTVFQSLKTTLPYFLGASNAYKAITEEYPDRVSSRMPEDLPVRYRGFLENDIDRCSGCKYCVDACPVNCIKIETEPGHEANQSWVAVFDIDHGKCMFCGLCVEVCPTRSLVHTREYRGAVRTVAETVQSFGKGRTTAEMRKRWESDRKSRAAKAEELAMYEENPVGAEIKRMNISDPKGDDQK